MMTRKSIVCFGVLALAAGFGNARAQGLHFSEYYNAPILVNPANTALMNEHDYRLGANYRTQWTSVPVPFKTFSAYADFEAFKNQNTTNWLGIGLAFYNDGAGDGNLNLTKGDLTLAYHVQTNDVFMISAGLQGGYANRSVNYNQLYFGLQWDGFKFDKSRASGENLLNVVKTNYFDVGAGINFSYFPNELVFVKMGVGFSHINQPKETFYNGTNSMAIRPSFNLDAAFVLDRIFSISPSVFYSAERGASELVVGSLVTAKIVGEDRKILSLIGGVHYRYNEAVIGSLGLQYSNLRIMGSYDYAISSLGAQIKNYGAMEFGLVFMGMYGERSHAAKNMNCPRFY